MQQAQTEMCCNAKANDRAQVTNTQIRLNIMAGRNATPSDCHDNVRYIRWAVTKNYLFAKDWIDCVEFNICTHSMKRTQ
jgi:hypothetical protein